MEKVNDDDPEAVKRYLNTRVVSSLEAVITVGIRTLWWLCTNRFISY